MYDLNKIIVIGSYLPNDEDSLETVVMKTNGMKVTDLLYINDRNSCPNKHTEEYDEYIKELRDELYEDMYDDDLNIKASDAFTGEDAIKQVATFIDDIWDNDSLLYFYNSESKTFNLLERELMCFNGKIYLSDYHDIFVDGKDIEKDITVIMKEQGLNTANMLKDSTISFMYFLHGLVEKMINK